MSTRPIIIFVLMLAALPASLSAQNNDSGLDVFGYFQASLYKDQDSESGKKQNTFTLQQLNLMLQKDLSQRWSSFVNFEFTNSFSSFDNWGSFSLEEAWAQYRQSRYFRLKLGLLIPRFNNLNIIKNRTPLLPYIIRPLVYETSFQESFPIEEFIPEQAYVQIHGSAPVGGEFKIDYSGYWGNSPNISTGDSSFKTGLDSTDTFLFGIRLGVRHPNFKLGFSSTSDKTNRFIVLIDLKPKTDVKVAFYDYLGKSASRMKSIWMKNMLTGEGQPPVSVETQEAILERVATTPGAIGYIDRRLVTDQVITLTVIPYEND